METFKEEEYGRVIETFMKVAICLPSLNEAEKYQKYYKNIRPRIG